ncbi:FG-GAP-like repeat-containing protein [Paraliomyxa miuraensis]|uniref:FG-GAP-like repeat-containing protein n=1 Tax=Paraliomyxa miuraensis TaxID=376150 RepID=UPI00225149A5|nr:FG-GAP-like repeat-containing protein [Paraliomyxa miuraensis]MCX4240575.1 hypothetical protein [Paraliomyxa miuraensis]
MHVQRLVEIAIALALALFSWSTPALAEPGTFVEPEVEVLHTFEGEGGSFGWAVSAVGDVDGDGVSEALTSAPFDPRGGANAGRVYLYSGATGAELQAWTGVAGDRLGYAIADAGDVDGDGTPDVLAGAPGAPGAMGTVGRAYLYSGIDGSEIAVLIGNVPGDRFGAAVTGVGDVDGDGLADVLVGAPGDPTMGTSAGRVALFGAADWTTPRWIRDGAVGEQLGGGTGPIGDVDGDGIADVVIGASGNGGAVWVLSGDDGSDVHPPLLGDASAVNLGHFFVAGVGDLDGDGVPEIYGGDYGDGALGPGTGRAYVWSGATGERLFTFGGVAAGDGLGCGRGGGDADGDGIPDLAIGSYSASPAGVSQAGFITVFSGATGDVLRTITGTTAMEQVGFDVVTIGDVNGDGRDDLVLSGANDDRVYVIAGVVEEDPGGTGSTGAGEETGGSTGDGMEVTGTAGPELDTGGSGPSATSGDQGSSTGAGDSTGTTSEDSDDSGGCGCRSRGTAGGWSWMLGVVPIIWRRRGQREG